MRVSLKCMMPWVCLASLTVAPMRTNTVVAEDYYLNVSQPAGTDWDDLKTSNVFTWTSEAVPTAEHNYYVTSGDLRSPTNTSVSEAVFGGGALYIEGNGTLIMKSHCTVNNFILKNGGSLNLSQPGTEFEFAGTTLTIDGSGKIKSTGATRTLKVSSQILGDENAVLTLDAQTDKSISAKISFTNKNNTFSGTVNLTNTSTLLLPNGGTLGSDSVKLVTGEKAKLSIDNSNLTDGKFTIGNWNANYYSAASKQTILMPNKITVSNKYMQEALATAGIDAPIGATIVSTTSAREAKEYTLNRETQSSDKGWDTAGIWIDKDGNASSYIPTVGDTVNIEKILRTVDNITTNQYFLAKTKLNSGGILALKNKSSQIIIPDLVLNGGSIRNYIEKTTMTLDGHITVLEESELSSRTNNSTLCVKSDISGSAQLNLTGGNSLNPVNQVHIELASNNEEYTGRMEVAQYTNVKATTQFALGKGTVRFLGNNTLTYDGTQSLEEIIVNKDLTINGNWTLNVNNLTSEENGSVINLTSGNLKVGTWGSETLPITLNQTGGKLALANDEFVFYGDFNQTAGTLQMTLGAHPLEITGDTQISNLVLDLETGFEFDEDEIYNVITVADSKTFNLSDFTVILNNSDIALSGGLIGNQLFIGSASTIASTLPEPSTWVILLVGAFGILSMRRCRKH